MPNQILIVDNKPEDAAILERFLRQRLVSNPIQELTDGLLAMDYLLGKGAYGNRGLYPFPVLIFLELGLPGKSGLEIVEWLDAHPEITRPRIVIHTRWNGFAGIEKANMPGLNAILIKQGLEDQIPGILKLFPEVWEFGNPVEKKG